MKRWRRRVAGLLAALSLASALVVVGADAASAAAPVRIMPLGDSITSGLKGDATYRYWLWQRLVNVGYDIDLVGSMTATSNGAPRYAGFDQDHEGHGGYRADQVADSVVAWASAAGPDIVLVHLGTNDLDAGESNASTKEDLRTIIQRLRQVNPSIAVVLAQIIPSTRTWAPQVPDLNTKIAQLASEETSPDSPVVVADQYTGFNTATDLRDDAHPNEAGHRKMAKAWQTALVPLLGSRSPASALFVVAQPSSLISGDAAALARLRDLGFTVDVASASASAASAANRRLVVISASVNATTVGARFRDVPVPVLTWEHALFDDLGMTAAAGSTRSGQKNVSITSPGHALAAGLTGTATTSTSATYRVGSPGSAAIRVAALTADPRKFVEFGYETGVAMPGAAAPARRLALFYPDNASTSLLAGGWALFDAAAQWTGRAATGSPTPNSAPVATAGPDQSVDVATPVTLNGSGSYDPDSGPSPLAYAWQQTGGPAASLSGADTATPAFTPDSVGTYTFRLTVNDGADVSSDSVDVTATSATSTSEVLFVVGSSTLGAGDSAIRDHLVTDGLAVSIADDDAVTSSSPSGYDLVLISDSITPAVLGTKLRATTVPVVVWKASLFDEMAMAATTDQGNTAAQTSIAILQSSHQLAAGFDGEVNVVTSAGKFKWARPASGATAVASVVGQPTQVTIFGFDTGSSMLAMNAPARRVGTFLDDGTAASFTAAGWQLFDAAVDWALGV